MIKKQPLVHDSYIVLGTYFPKDLSKLLTNEEIYIRDTEARSFKTPKITYIKSYLVKDDFFYAGAAFVLQLVSKLIKFKMHEALLNTIVTTRLKDSKMPLDYMQVYKLVKALRAVCYLSLIYTHFSLPSSLVQQKQAQLNVAGPLETF